MTSSLRFQPHSVRLFVEPECLPERDQRVTIALFAFAERAVQALPQTVEPCAYQVFLRSGDVNMDWDERQPAVAVHGEHSRAGLVD